MTGMEILKKLQLREEIYEAVCRMELPKLELKFENYEENLEKLTPIANENSGLLIFRYFLELSAELKRRYDVLGISEEVFLDNIKDLALWAEDYYVKHGRPGFAAWRWVFMTLSMKVFRLGRLQFEPTQLYKKLSCGDKVFPVGTPVLSVHIPAGEPLNIAAVKESFLKAPQFFKDYFNESFDYFYCHSWLVSPELKSILPAESGIIQFQSMFNVCEVDNGRQAEERVFGFLADNPAEYPEKTSLQRKMKAELAAGNHFGRGFAIFPIDKA